MEEGRGGEYKNKFALKKAPRLILAVVSVLLTDGRGRIERLRVSRSNEDVETPTHEQTERERDDEES